MAGVCVLAVSVRGAERGDGRIWGMGFLDRACVRSCVRSAQRQPPTGGTPRDWVQARPVLQPRLAALPSPSP